MKNHRKLILALLLIIIACRCHGDSATITVPDAVGFLVTDVNFGANSTPLTTQLSFSDASLAPGNCIRFGIKADSANFTRPAENGGSIASDKVVWVTSSDVHGTGYTGVLSSVSYTRVFQSAPGWTSGSTEVGWTLAPIGGGILSGDHILTANWKVESL